MKKKVIYFVSDFVVATSFKAAVNDATNQRNEFLKNNADEILEIENESLQPIYTSPHNSNIAIIITFTYYSK
jgi:hypothetical protein